MSTAVIGSEPYISDDDVVSRMPGMTKGNLAQLRYTGKGPKFYKPSPRVVRYKWSDVQALDRGSRTDENTMRAETNKGRVNSAWRDPKNPYSYAPLLKTGAR